MENITQKRFYGLDHLRALAITYVFLYHYFILSDGQPEWLPDFAKFGWSGVDLFFVLSGFLISSQLFAQIKNEQQLSFRAFFVKRIFRIIPAYLITLVLYFCIPLFREKESLPPLWKFLTFTQNIGLNLKDYGTFSHAWSLCVEEHFYLFLPLILLLLQLTNSIKKSYRLLIILFAFGFVIRLYSYNNLYLPNTASGFPWMYWYKFVYYTTYNRLDGLLSGVAIAGIYQFYPAVWGKISNYGNLSFILSIFVLIAAYFICYHQQEFWASIFGFTVVSLGYGLLVIAAISPSCFLYKWNSKATSFIATLSFAIYLTHKGVIHITHQLLQDYEIDGNVMMLICTATCTLFAYLLNIIVEKPFIKLGRKFIKSSSTFRNTIKAKIPQ